MNTRVIDGLVSALCIVSDPNRWCTGLSAKDATGDFTDPGGGGAVQWCAIGAISKVAGKNYRLEDEMLRAVLRANREVPGTAPMIIVTNDVYGREKIVEVFKRAILNLENDESERLGAMLTANVVSTVAEDIAA